MTVSNHTALSSGEIEEHLAKLDEEWSVTEANHLVRNFSFTDTIGSEQFMDFVRKAADAGEHHYQINSWSEDRDEQNMECYIEIWTPDINGLTSADFQFARKINTAYPNFS